MTTRLDQRGWTAAQDLAPCVRCNLPAIMRSCGHRGARPVTGPAPWRGSTSTRTTSKAKPSTASALHARAAAWRQLRNAPATELRTPARLWSARCAAAPGRKEMTSGRAIGVPLARVISGRYRTPSQRQIRRLEPVTARCGTPSKLGIDGPSWLTGMASQRDYCPRSAVAAGRARLTGHGRGFRGTRRR